MPLPNIHVLNHSSHFMLCVHNVSQILESSNTQTSIHRRGILTTMDLNQQLIKHSALLTYFSYLKPGWYSHILINSFNLCMQHHSYLIPKPKSTLAFTTIAPHSQSIHLTRLASSTSLKPATAIAVPAEFLPASRQCPAQAFAPLKFQWPKHSHPLSPLSLYLSLFKAFNCPQNHLPGLWPRRSTSYCIPTCLSLIPSAPYNHAELPTSSELTTNTTTPASEEPPQSRFPPILKLTHPTPSDLS